MIIFSATHQPLCSCLLIAFMLCFSRASGLSRLHHRRWQNTRRHLLLASAPSLVWWWTQDANAAVSTGSASDSKEFATSAGRKGCVTRSDPSKTTVTCLGELMPPGGGRLSTIAATENGVSTSAVKNPARYGPPWTFLTETSDSSTAWNSLVQAVQRLDQVQIITVTDRYLHAVAPTLQPPGLSSSVSVADMSLKELLTSPGLDDLEFLLRSEDSLVLYRSASRTAVFVYPLTQPVSDGNTNLQRLEKLRQQLGWSSTA